MHAKVANPAAKDFLPHFPQAIWLEPAGFLRTFVFLPNPNSCTHSRSDLANLLIYRFTKLSINAKVANPAAKAFFVPQSGVVSRTFVDRVVRFMK